MDKMNTPIAFIKHYSNKVGANAFFVSIYSCNFHYINRGVL